MRKREGYEVIRFVERGKFCHASLDYVQGITLYDWIKSHQKIDKKILYVWIDELLRQLILFHQQKGNPDYGKLNPYHIIIMEKQQIALLAVKEKESIHTLDKYFVPMDKRQNIDVYCIGKMIQFVMAHIPCEPGLSKIEEYKIQRIVRKCIEANVRKRYEDIGEIRVAFANTEKIRIPRKAGIVAAIFVLIIGLIGVIRGRGISEVKEKEKGISVLSTDQIQEKASKQENDKKEERDRELFLQMGIDYFLENENYDRSIQCLQNADIQDKKVNYYLKLAEFMNGDKTATDWIGLKSELKQEFGEENFGIKEMVAFLRICSLSGNEEEWISAPSKIELEEVEMEKEGLSEKLQIEFENYCAFFHESHEEWEEARQSYDALYEMNRKKMEEIDSYRKKGAKVNVKCLEMLWEDENVTEERRLEEIKKMIAQNLFLMQEEDFKRFISEKKIHIEEGKVWVEKTEDALKREDAG